MEVFFDTGGDEWEGFVVGFDHRHLVWLIADFFGDIRRGTRTDADGFAIFVLGVKNYQIS